MIEYGKLSYRELEDYSNMQAAQIRKKNNQIEQLQARVKDLEHEIKMAKRYLRDVLSERHAIEAALSDERQKAKKLEAEKAELRKFIEAKMHHLPIEDQHVASVMIQQEDDEGKRDGVGLDTTIGSAMRKEGKQ